MTESASSNIPPPIPASAARKTRVLIIVSIVSAVLVFGTLVCIRLWVLSVSLISSQGMYPTEKSGDIVVIYQLAYATASDVKRGDLVAFRTRVNGYEEMYFQRVVGIPGDRLITNANTSEIILNGVRAPQKYLREDGAVSLFEEKLGDRQYVIAVGRHKGAAQGMRFSGAITVPADCFFLMGDNRTNSFDSRYTGFVKFSDIVGRKL